MTDTPEMTEWLNRISLTHGEKNTFAGLSGKIGEARHLLYEDLGYDITRKQFEGLKEAKEIQEKVDALAEEKHIEQKWRTIPGRAYKQKDGTIKRNDVYQKFNADKNGRIGWHFAKRSK